MIIRFSDRVSRVTTFNNALTVSRGCPLSYIRLFVSSSAMVTIVQNGPMLSNKLNVMLSNEVRVSALLKQDT